MKRLCLLFLIYWGCENDDLVPKEVNYPGPVTLSLSSNVLEWTMNDDDDFFGYSLISTIIFSSIIETVYKYKNSILKIFFSA